MKDLLLEAKGIGKSFGENTVLKDVNFNLAKGEILGLVGENGAGKSTLMNIIFGMEVINETGGYNGEILLDGEVINFKNPIDALNAGVGMVHQEFNLIPGFTVAENITLNMEKTNKNIVSTVLGKKYEIINSEENIKTSEKSLETLGVDLNSNKFVKEMPVGHKQFIEIAREITRENVKLIIMDEPTAVLTESEAEILVKSLKRLASMGISIIFISHRLNEVIDLCDNIIILRDGVVVENKKSEDFTVKEIAKLMVGRNGRDREEHKIREELDKEDIIMSIKNLYVKMPGEYVKNLNLDIIRGEILGIAGIAGQGKLGIPNGILGTYPVSGEVKLNNENLKLGDTYSILKKKVAFVSEDRRGVGLLLEEPIYWNIAFNAMQIQNKYLKKILGIKFRDEKAMKDLANRYIDILAIKCTGPEQRAQNLSGGNQQKVCLAKAFAMEPELLFVSEPTRGIDIGAKELVLDSLKKTNIEDNTTIVMVSSELEELRSICDRIAVICEGKIVGILPSNDSAENFGLLMSGLSIEEVS